MSNESHYSINVAKPVRDCIKGSNKVVRYTRYFHVKVAVFEHQAVEVAEDLAEKFPDCLISMTYWLCQGSCPEKWQDIGNVKR